MFRHYQTSIDYAKLIKTQASQPAPFTSGKDFKKGSKEANRVSSAKVKTIGKRRNSK